MAPEQSPHRPIPLLPVIHLAGIGLALVLALALGGLFPQWFTNVDQRLGDAFWRMGSDATPEQRLLIVDIDEASLNELGSWPWPRQRLAQISERLAEAGVRMQVFDIVLNAEQPGDTEVAAILKKNNALHAQLMALDQGAETRSGHLPITAGVLGCQQPMPQAHGYIASAPAYAALATGHITPRVNTDGIVRRQPAYICVDGHAYPALGLAAFLQGSGIHTPPELKLGQSGLGPTWQLHIPGIEQMLPLNADGDMQIPYRINPSAMQAVSAADLLAGRVPAELLKGRWALISSTAFGLGDVVSTPFGGAQGGVSVHLQLMAGLLDDRIPFTPKAETGLQLGAAVAGILLLLGQLAITRRRGLPGYGLPLAGLLLGGALIGAQAWAQTSQGILIGMTLPALAILLSGGMLGAAELILTRGERSRLLTYLASYLPTPVAEKLLAQPPQAEVVAEHRNVAVLYADIRNFSAYCEAYEAERAANVLHRFYSTASQVVEAHGGLIEAMQGDAILAIWNGSQPCDQAAEKALRAALELQPRIESELPRDPLTSLPPPLALGIGLEYGPALIGSFGPRQRRVHSALGKTISIAVRLQSLTADLSWPILAGPGIAAQINNHAEAGQPDNNPRPSIHASMQPQGEFLLEGLTQPCHVYALNPAK